MSVLIIEGEYGYVVENFLGPNVYTGEQSPYITKGGKICVWPNMKSVPPKWRQYARPATKLEASIGHHMFEVREQRVEERMR